MNLAVLIGIDSVFGKKAYIFKKGMDEYEIIGWLKIIRRIGIINHRGSRR